MSSLCQLLNIQHPILQSGMGRVAGPELAAEVSRAGGLGILAGLNVPADTLRAQIGQLRELAGGAPFGVNLWLHPELQPPIHPARIRADDIASVNAVLNEARRAVDVPESMEPPEPRADLLPDAIDVMLDERVPVWSVGLGLPDADLVLRCHERNVKVMVMIANVEDAREAASLGVDIIVAQGAEAGGHRSTWRVGARADVGTFSLVPEVVDAVGVPVVAAGGIADGRGLVAALALGAAGVLLGTRFVATRESLAPDSWKRAILKSTSDATAVTTAFTGFPARVLRNRFVDHYEGSGAPVLPGLLQASLEESIWTAAKRDDRDDYYPMYAGQSVGVIRDLPSAGDVVRTILNEAQAVMRRLTLTSS